MSVQKQKMQDDSVRPDEASDQQSFNEAAKSTYTDEGSSFIEKTKTALLINDSFML